MTGLMLLIGFAMGLLALLTLPWWAVAAFVGVGVVVVGGAALLLATGAHGLSDGPTQ